MNFLAHAYLSFYDRDILAGNMISDFVKGKKQYDYTMRIHQGIMLHREIDHYTDTHSVVKKARSVFQDAYRLYSGAFIDIVFDHFLALDKNEFPEGALEKFCLLVYDSLDKSFPALPPVFQQLFPYMKQQNWLYNYRTAEGIERSFRGLVHRARFIHESNSAIKAFHKHYSFLSECYLDFFPGLKQYALLIFNALPPATGAGHR
jgi:acyl carrier protein phosphodiesterase